MSEYKAEAGHRIQTVVNGELCVSEVSPRWLLADFLRDQLGLTGTHVGCEHGACGACTVLLDDQPVRSCLLFAVQANGHRITTVEGLSAGSELNVLQRAFQSCHALQCGFCTPGFLISCTALLRDNPQPSEVEIKEALGGHLCRCTGYANIIKAVREAAAQTVP